jgi:hypothetical protein
VGPGRETIQNLFDILMDQRMVGDFLLKVLKFAGRGQVSVNKQVRCLQETGFRSKIFYRIAAIPQDSVFAVQVSDGTGSGAGILKTGIQGNVSALSSQFADINSLLLLATFYDRAFIGFSIYFDFGSVIGHVLNG